MRACCVFLLAARLSLSSYQLLFSRQESILFLIVTVIKWHFMGLHATHRQLKICNLLSGGPETKHMFIFYCLCVGIMCACAIFNKVPGKIDANFFQTNAAMYHYPVCENHTHEKTIIC